MSSLERLVLATLVLLCPLLPSQAAESDIRLVEAFNEPFDDNSRHWPHIKKGHDWHASIQQGSLVWTNSRQSGDQATKLQLPLSSRRKYEIVLEARLFEKTSGKNVYGLTWGGHPDVQRYHAFTIDPDNGFRIFTYRDNTTEVHGAGPLGEIYRPRGNNLISLRKLGEQSAFFVNGVCVHIGPTLDPIGPMAGPYTGPGTRAAYDSLRINYLLADQPIFEERLTAYHAALGDASQTFFALAELPADELSALIEIVQDPAEWSVIQGWYDEAFQLIQKKEYAQAASKLRETLSHAPEYSHAHAQYAYVALMLGDLSTARQHADFAKLFGPIEASSHAIDAYVSAAEGQEDNARRALALSFFFTSSENDLQYYKEDFQNMLDEGVATEQIRALKAKADSLFAQRSRAYATVAAANATANEAYSNGLYDEARSHFVEARERLSSLPAEYTWVKGIVLSNIGLALSASDDFRSALPYLESALGIVSRHKDSVNPFARSLLAQTLCDLYRKTGDSDNAYQVGISELPHTMELPYLAGFRKDLLLTSLCYAAFQKTDDDALRKHASHLLSRAREQGNTWNEANALSFLANSYMSSTLPPDRKIAAETFEQALELSRAEGYDSVANDVLANLAIVYYRQGEKAKAKQTYADLIASFLENDQALQAESVLNNKGALHVLDQEWSLAAAAFQQAVDIIEAHRDHFTGVERIRFLESRRGVYQFLAFCQAEAKQAAALFKTQNAIRARVLAENLLSDDNADPVSLQAFQATLDPDEAALFYTRGDACEVVIHVVTRDHAQPIIRKHFDPFIKLKASYLDRMSEGIQGYKPVGQQLYGSDGIAYIDRTKENQVSNEDFERLVELCRGLIDRSVKAEPALRDRVVKESLQAFQELLIQPALPYLAGKRKLLIFPDEILYFLPFDALPHPDGRYLVEHFDIRYAQSADVRQILRVRRYADDRKSFFAMGGAIYGEMNEKAQTVSDELRQLELQVKAAANAREGKPQRDVYAALFSKPMAYLKGTLIEVATLSQLFPDSTVFIGEEMTETRIKAMSQTGELANYKVVHLATHGFALPELPQLSGIAMCIFPEMRNGQDGYLTAPEIAQLGMKADLAVLSACQTGLGRIYGGEGVAGLTSSLLVGGANRALVTLWPVDDAGTMNFMTGLYQLVENEGKDYAAAANEMKRRFIRGDFGERFRDLFIWAPFVLYGP